MNIKLLERTLSKIKDLKEEEFKFDLEITKSKDTCGTVCCIMGWLPKFFPEMDFTWKEYTGFKKLVVFYNNQPLYTSNLKEIYGLDSKDVSYLFTGEPHSDTRLPGINSNSNLKEVTEAWEKFIELNKLPV